jgi:hypothetical protein
LPVDFARLIWSLLAHGYLDRVLPKVCVDDPDGVEPDPEALLADRLGISGLWPLQPETWSDDLSSMTSSRSSTTSSPAPVPVVPTAGTSVVGTSASSPPTSTDSALR